MKTHQKLLWLLPHYHIQCVLCVFAVLPYTMIHASIQINTVHFHKDSTFQALLKIVYQNCEIMDSYTSWSCMCLFEIQIRHYWTYSRNQRMSQLQTGSQAENLASLLCGTFLTQNTIWECIYQQKQILRYSYIDVCDDQSQQLKYWKADLKLPRWIALAAKCLPN